MKRTVMIFAGAGAVIPIILIIAVRIELYFNPQEVPRALLLRLYLWPSSMWLLLTNLPGDSSRYGDFVVWTLSILANVLLYALIGLILSSIWNFISKWTSIGSGL